MAGALRLSPITTASLALVPFEEATARAVLAGDLRGIEPGVGWPQAGTGAGLRNSLERGGPLPWMVLRDGRVIGDCGLHGPPDERGEVEIGYGLAAPYRGRGYGSELVAAISDWLLAQPAIGALLARTEADNVASIRALQRAGFVRSAGAAAGGLIVYRRAITRPS